jgi:hypothetical protein
MWDRLIVLKLVFLAVFLVGCGQFKVDPVNLDGQPIIGHWYIEQNVQEGDDHFYQRLYLHVRADGHVLYANLLCRSNEAQGSANESRLVLEYLPIKRISTKKMVLQSYPLTPKFEIKLGLWPDDVRAAFEVDNLTLSKVVESTLPDYKSWICP